MGNTILQYKSGHILAKLENTKKALVSDVSFSIDEGQSLALVGETGSGKTMIAQAIMRLLPSNVEVEDSEVLFAGSRLPSAKGMQKLLGVEIVYIPQNGLEFLDPSRTVRKQLCDSLKKLGIPSGAFENMALEKLKSAGLDDPQKLLDRYPFQLSGGMAQRVVITLAACSRAKLVIADEPTNGLDYEVKFDFQALLRTLFPDAARLVITHDIAVAETCDRTLVLCKGEMMEKGASSAVLTAPHSPYTKTLLASQVKNGMKESPVLRPETGACPFYRRCPQAAEACMSRRERHQDGDAEWWCNT